MPRLRGEGRVDLRVVKTREAIEFAFEKLLESVPYPEITVSAVAREARVSRKTFYAHYASVSDLFEIMVQHAVDEIADEIQPEGQLLDVDEWIVQFTHATLARLKNSPHLGGNIERLMPAGSLVEVLRRPLEELCERELAKRGLAVVDERGYVLSFFIGGLCATYETWASRAQGAASLEEAANLIARAATQGVGDLLKPAL